MITDAERDNALLRYYQRGILKQEVRSYEVSLWTLQDQFMTVLKWSDVEQKGRIEEPKMELDVDGTLNFTFTIPMYITKWDENASYMARMTKIENPIWYNTLNGNLIEGLRKIKVIFNKGYAEEETFEFVIIKITEKHEQDIATCEIECEGLAFHELGKIGYKLHLSLEDFELVYKEWSENGYWTKRDGTTSVELPILNVLYWCEECAGLVPWPGTSAANSRTWYYHIDMDWSSYAFSSSIVRVTNKVYEEPFTTSWTDELIPKAVEQYKEKARPVEANLSNLYNITQTIAELFGIHCRYQYNHDANYLITSKVVVFYNSYNKEKEGILGFTYPYSSKTVKRNVDVTDLTTKLYISPVNSDNSLEGTITIMNSSANKIKEDYILNFDYIHKINGITDELYAAVAEFEKKIRKKNEDLIPALLERDALESKKIEVDAKLAVYKNSIDLDKELITYNTALENALDVSDGDADGYITVSATSPDTAIIVTSDDNVNYINLEHTQKGIDINTVHVYHGWSAGNGTCLDEVTGFNPVYDSEYGNLIKLEKIPLGTDNSRTVYLTYKYKPKLYYENILTTWQIKLFNDLQNESKYEMELIELESAIDTANNTIDTLLREKQELLDEFERMMGPALREGYWTPEDYRDYGEIKTATLSLSNTAEGNPFTTESEEDVVIGWDDLLFDTEDEIYYSVSINERTVYYPCLNLSSIFANNPNNIREHINEYSFIFNNNYEDHTADLTNIRYIRSFSVGSEALLRFVKNESGTVFPILVLIGAKNMSDGSNGSFDEISFMKRKTSGSGNNIVYGGNPRLGIINSAIDSTTVNTVISNVIEVHASSYWTFGSNNIELCTLICPRINFNNISVKADATNLKIAYSNILLEPYTDFQITTRVTHYNIDGHLIDHPEYYINLKPEVLWRCGTYTGDAKINYIVSNLATSIYIDALEVSKKNAEPKVEYDLEANIIDGNLIHTLYKDLARIIMITDVDLKLEDAFGYISHIELNLDKPEEDTIEIKNYTSKFEDLFSTIVASTEAILRNSNGIASALGGNIGLSAAGFSDMLKNNEGTLKEFLDGYFTSSYTVEEMLGNLFTEAGNILGSSNKILNNTIALTSENASILSGFADKVVQELSPKVVRSTTKPTDFKVGDIWILTEAIPDTDPVQYREVGRYVATSDNLHSVGDYGFTRTYDGSLALITGASTDIDAENGTIEILARNSITVGSGGDLYLGANNKVDIVGNTAVNIGGTQVNLASTTVDGNNIESGINIVAAQYDDLNVANMSKVSIKPTEIYMAGALITMLTGNGSDAVSAIKIDGRTVSNGGADYGIWLGSNKGIRLFSGTPTTANNLTTYGANVEINPTHIFFGMGNTSNGNATAAELTEKHIIFAAGNVIGSLDGDNEDITLSNSIAGVKITKNKIGLAVNTNNDTSRSSIIMDGTGLEIGTAAITDGTAGNPKTLGSYVAISGAGIIIGSLGNMEVNTTNFKIKSNATGATPMFYVASDGTWANANNGILYTPDGGLLVKGTITANTLYIYDPTALEGQQYPDATDWINAKVTPEAIWLGVVKHTTGDNNATISASTSLSLTDSGITIASTGMFAVDTTNVIIKTNAVLNETIFQLKDGNIDYLKIAKDSSGVLTASLVGWNISGKKLYSGSSTSYVALDADASNTYAIWCGAEIDSSGKFRVTRTGDVYLNSLMVYDPNNTIAGVGERVGDYVRINFSGLNFKDAVSLNSGGSWSGSTFTASVRLWGKINKSIAITASADVSDLEFYPKSIDGTIITFSMTPVVYLSVNGQLTHIDLPTSFERLYEVPDEIMAIGRKVGWNAAADMCLRGMNITGTRNDYFLVPLSSDSDIGAGNNYYLSSYWDIAYNSGWNACLDNCTAHQNAIYGYSSTSANLYTGTRTTVSTTDGDVNVLSPYTYWSGGGFKGGTTATLYEIPARR